MLLYVILGADSRNKYDSGIYFLFDVVLVL